MRPLLTVVSTTTTLVVLSQLSGTFVNAQCTHGEVRVNSGSDFGRVEVCFNGTWGTFCDDFWDDEDASVACRQLGFSQYGAIAATGRFTEGTLPLHVIDINCTGAEQRVLDCPHNNLVGQHACDHRQDASVRCQAAGAIYSNCSDGDLRLSGGETEYQGRVEICINNLWGSICYSSSRYGNYWNVDDGRVVCRALGHQELGLTIYQTAISRFGQGSGPVFLADIRCSGSEDNLLECPRNVFVGIECTHSRDVGLRCQPVCENGAVRISNSTESFNSSFGRVEVCVNGTWGTVCSDFWENEDASVVCKQLGYSENGAVAGRGLYSESVLPIHIVDMNCTGSEHNIWECGHNGLISVYSCASRNDASVRCQDVQIGQSNCSDGDVRLVDGSTDFEGRVEVCINRVWGTVCSSWSRYYYSSSWNVNDAKVVCRQLGHQELGSTTYSSSSTFGPGTDPVYISNVGCVGSETNLLHCPHYNFIQLASTTYCTHNRDVGLKCLPSCSDGAVRVVSSSNNMNSSFGRVEVCVNRTWGTICSDFWDNEDASIVCKQLGYSEYASCSDGAVRVVSSSNNMNSSFGRVEVCVNRTWGTICSDFWDNEDASIVCKQLGYSEYGALAGRGFYTEGLWPFHIIDINCTGMERSIWECERNGLFDMYNCPSANDASIRCQATEVISFNCSDGDVRLVDGSTDFEGRVEVCISRVWGTVCSSWSRYYYLSSWNVNDAKVVCRQLGHQELGSTTYSSSSTFGPGTDPVYISNVGCVGSETNLLHCPHYNFIQLASTTYCTHNRDVGLKCLPLCANGAVRVVFSADNLNSSIGRVEVCVNGTWGTVCSDFWENEDASVVCKQLGYSEYGAIAGKGAYTESVWPFHIIDLNCTGIERTIWECPHNDLYNFYSCPSRNDASVICQAPRLVPANCSDGDVRLVDGLTDFEGRVEVCINRIWGTVCASTSRYYYNYWNVNDAKVVCRQLGHQELGSTSYSTSSTFGPGVGPVLLSNTHCLGSETSLLHCPHTVFVGTYCTHGRDVGLRCEAKCSSGTVRLVSDSNSYFRSHGRVELCINETWTSVCDEYWDNLDASVVCHQLGYSRYGAIANRDVFIEQVWPTVVTNVSCFGTEDTLLDCSYTTRPISSCNTRSDASVICQSISTIPSNCTTGDIKLSGEVTAVSGRLEICINQAWGTVCNYEWDIRDARVACRELGYQQFYGYTVSTSSSIYADVGSGPIFLYRTDCNGLESNVKLCNSLEYPSRYRGSQCNHYDDVTLQCRAPCNSGDVRLYGTSVERAGVVHVCVNGTWGKVCGGDNSPQFASIICSQLGYSPFGAVAKRSIWSDNYFVFTMYHPLCVGNESNILDCSFSTHDTVPSSCNQNSVLTSYRYYYYNNYDVTSIVCLPDDLQPIDCEDGNIRLVGESEYRGRLEICQNHVWGTVCASHGFSTDDANVICGILGHQTFGSSVFSTPTTKNNPPMFADFGCSRAALNLNRCRYPEGRLTSVLNCGPNVIGIQCVPTCEVGEVRLIGGDRYGRVEICGGGVWGTVCSDSHWDDVDAGVVCKQLGYSSYGSIAVANWFSEREKIALLHSVECIGTEESIFECRTNEVGGCTTYQDAAVVCPALASEFGNCTTGDVQLVDGPSPNKGRVEVCINQAWASVCNRNFHSEEANVVCGQLGYSTIGAQVRGVSYYGQGSGPLVSYFICNGRENNLFDCGRYLQDSISCSHSSDVGIDCEIPCVNGSVRLAGSQWRYLGRVEVCVNNTWGTICVNFWDVNDTAVICRQLGYTSTDSSVYNGYGEGTLPVHIIDVNCTGFESSIWDCPLNAISSYNCQSRYRDAAVTCAVDIPTCSNDEEGHTRLVDGLSMYEGRVEVCKSGEWGTICNQYWDNQDAVVICRQLGFPTAGAISTSNYRYGTGLIHFSDFTCTGEEFSILSCHHSSPRSYCSHSRDAGVICRAPCITGEVQLVGDHRYDNFGRVEVCINGTWGKVCNNMWENKDASVLCQQLGFSPHGAITRSTVYPQSTTLDYYIMSANCSGEEDTFFECPYTLMQPGHMCSSDAGVICQETLPDSISLQSNCTNFEIRLQSDSIDGTRGKLEMCFNGVWGSVCSGGLRGESSKVACNQLGHQKLGFSTFSIAYEPYDVVTVNEIYCSGNDLNMSQCRVQFYTKTASCNLRHTTGLVCIAKCRDGDVRLAGSFFERLGRVEVCVNGTWGTICDDHWDNNDASVVCKQLGYSQHGAIAIHNSFSESVWPVHINELNCTGLENTWKDCSHNATQPSTCHYSHDASVSCRTIDTLASNCTDGDLRVESMDSSEASGRLEICDNNVWFSVFRSTSWTSSRSYYQETPNFACQSLGYSNIGVSVYAVYYLDHSFRPLYPLDFVCPGPSSPKSSFLSDCVGNYHSNEYQASTLYEVGIKCSSGDTVCDHGQVRIIGSNYNHFGRIEVCINGTWGTICDDFWNNTDASVVCRQLGYSPFGAIALSGVYTERYQPTLINDLNCTGNEMSILDCPFNFLTDYSCYRYADAAVICQDAPVVSDCLDGDIQLVGGPTPQEGTVQICANSVWGSVCHRSWNTPDANVACFQLGYQPVGATAVLYSFFGKRDGIFYMTGVSCSGSESRLVDCRHSSLALTSCGDGEFAGVKCLEACEEATLRLRGSRRSPLGGRVEVCIDLSWTTVCDETWDNLDASVVCRQLGFSPFGAIAAFGHFTEAQLSFGITDVHCNGTEENITSCSHNEAELHNCQQHDDAGVICQESSTVQSPCDDGEMRLVGGYSRNEGRVEVCINQAWGTICDRNWNTEDANVVCGQLGFLQQGALARVGAYFGMGNGPILLADVFCSGNEASLLDCNRNTFGVLTCNHFNDAGVTCEIPCTDGDARIRSGPNRRTGRVEVCVDESWGTICDHEWNSIDASVVCRQLGFSPYGAIAAFGHFTEAQLSFGITDVHCNGTEENITSCSHNEAELHNCQQHDDAGVICQESSTVQSPCDDGEMRLVGGYSSNEGRVEVCINQAWGTICDRNWNTEDANVVCGQLGFLQQGALARVGAYFGMGNGPILLADVFCSGNEASLLDCNRNTFGVLSCNHFSDAGVTCEIPCTDGDARIRSGPNRRTGRVEVCVDRSWGTICDHEWNSIDASVVCRQLGFSPYGSIALSTPFNDYTWPTLIFGINCMGNETAISDCSRNETSLRSTCRSNQDASILCQVAETVFSNCTNGDVRLMGGASDNEGRVEVCYGRTWGTVCDNGWSHHDGNIVCRQLGYQPLGAVAFPQAHFGHGSGPVLFTNVYCSGNEASLLDCYRNARDVHRCTHAEDAGVRCQGLCTEGSVRITGTNSDRYGTVEVCTNGTWGTICNDFWDDIDAKVTCRQLGHSQYGALSSGDFSGLSPLTITLMNVSCSGFEDTLTQCRSTYVQPFETVSCSTKAGILCQASSLFSNCENGAIRLAGSSQPYQGRVEICVYNTWGTVCDDHWDVSEGNLVCRQLGFQPLGATPRYRAYFGRGQYPIILGALYCSGQESSLLECERSDSSISSCSTNEVAGIQCEELCDDGDVRIADGPTELIGRVEICVNRTWGTVCEQMWNDIHALVVCRQLGYSANGAIAGSGGFPILGRPSYMSGVACDGSERSLFQCSHSLESNTDCNNERIAGVICQVSSIEVSDCEHGDIRLNGGRKPTEGRVEVCIHGVWGTVCDDGWDVLDANVVCGQLGFYPFGAEPRYGAFYGEGSQPLLVADMFCSGTERDLLTCQRNVFGITHCNAYEEAGVKCLGSFPITLSRRAGSLLGGDNIIVSGLSLREDDEIFCSFDKTENDGLYISETQALCVTPSSKEETYVDFRLIIKRGNNNVTGGALYQYISPEDADNAIGIDTEQKIIWNSREVANITWLPSSLIMTEVISSADVKVDLSLLLYNEETDDFEESMMLATNLPNNGVASIELPDSKSFPTSQDDVRAAILKLSVNTSTTIMPVTKRSAHQSVLSRVLRGARKFAKTRFISTLVKGSIVNRLLCEVWVAATPRFPQRSIPPCPCNMNDAKSDDRYEEEGYDSKGYVKAGAGLLRRYVFHRGSRSCFRQANVRDFGPGQQCCYDDSGNIITGNNGGTADLVAPTNWKTTTLHFLVDVVPWFLCCVGLFRDCGRYTSRRPVDDCSEWPERPPPARMFGDPHIVTLDGYRYTFNGKGEFVLSETLDGSFMLQGRMTEPHLSNSSNQTINGTIRATAFEALAIKEGNTPTVQLEITNDDLIVLIDGERIDFTAIQEQTFSNVTVSDVGNSTFIIRYASGFSVTASLSNNILTNILVTVPEHYSTRGLLGQFNGDPSDDLLPQDGTIPLPNNSTIENIHYNFGISWIIADPHQSLFTYGPNGDWDTYYQPDFNPTFEPNFSDSELEEQAQEICGDDALCLFDIAATGSIEIGSNTMDSVLDQENLRVQFVPRVCNPSCENGACIGNNTCACSEGFSGSKCEIEVYVACDVDICENGGMCKQLARDYICDCPPEYTGSVCQNKVDTPVVIVEDDVSLGVIIGPSIAAFVVLLVVTAFAICCITQVLKRKKGPKKQMYEVEMDKKADSVSSLNVEEKHYLENTDFL